MGEFRLITSARLIRHVLLSVQTSLRVKRFP